LKKKNGGDQRWAFVIQCTTATVTVSGTVSGRIAAYLK
jgi:hypothetical protein